MTDIFDEVEEDLRRRKAEEFWKKYWPAMATVAFVIVAGIGGWRFYEWRNDQAAAAAGARFEAAMRLSRDNANEAERRFTEIAADAPAGYRVLARFRQATELAAREPVAGAGAFEALANDASVDALLQDVARIRGAYLLVDLAPYEEIVRRVEALAAPGRAMRHSAREILALAALRASNKSAAERWLQAIQTDTDTPQGLRGRADLIAAVVAGLPG